MNINKNASFRVKDLNTLGKMLKQVGVNNTDDAIKGIYNGDKGFIYGAGKWLGKKIPNSKKVIDKVDEGFDKLQRGLTNYDIKAGNFVANKMKNPKMFLKNHKIKVDPGKSHFTSQHRKYTKNPLESADKYIEIEIPSIVAPIEKAKNVVVPMAGAMYLSDKLEKLKSNKGGDSVVKNAFPKEELINKIAGELSKNSSKLSAIDKVYSQGQLKKAAELTKKASEMLKVAAIDNKDLRDTNEKLANENKKLELALISRVRAEKAEKLASSMFQKGIIKKAEFSSKIDEIMEMDDTAYNVLNDTVSRINKSASNEEGVEKLSYILDDLTNSEEKDNIESKKTLKDSISEELNKK